MSVRCEGGGERRREGVDALWLDGGVCDGKAGACDCGLGAVVRWPFGCEEAKREPRDDEELSAGEAGPGLLRDDKTGGDCWSECFDLM